MSESLVHLRGFASMKDKERQRQIASAGGKAAHKAGTAHQWTSLEAKEAGRRGGRARAALFKKPEQEAA